MKIKNIHSWNLEPKSARKCQNELAKEVNPVRYRKLSNGESNVQSVEEIKLIASCDVAYSGEIGFSSVVVFETKNFNEVEICMVHKQVKFPYIPGLLSFREIPPLLKAFKKINKRPDCVLCDGQGIAHPIRMGLATHLGMFLDIPTVGCAKSLLFGKYDEPPPLAGTHTFIKNLQGDIIGACLRTRTNVRPVFISPGWKMSLSLAMEIIFAIMGRGPKYRIPLPLRRAHFFAEKAKRDYYQSR